MNETERADGNAHRSQPQQSPQVTQASEVVVDGTATLPTYASSCRVTASPEEVLLDFGLNSQPFAAGRQVVKANQRVVMNFFSAKRLLSAIGVTIRMREQTFDGIEPGCQPPRWHGAVSTQPRRSPRSYRTARGNPAEPLRTATNPLSEIDSSTSQPYWTEAPYAQCCRPQSLASRDTGD